MLTHFQDLNCALQVNLIFIQSSFLACISKSSFDSQHELPARLGTIDVLFKILEEVDEAELFGHVSCVVVESRSVKEGFALLVFHRLNHLVGARQTFFCSNAGLHVVLVSLFVPLLVFLVVLAQEMSPYFVVKNSLHSSTSILTRKFDVHSTLSSFGIMRHTGGCNLIFLKVY